MSLCDGLISLSIASSRFIHVVACTRNILSETGYREHQNPYCELPVYSTARYSPKCVLTTRAGLIPQTVIIPPVRSSTAQ